MDISAALKQVRKETTTLNQSEFAEKLGITQTYLSLLENGHKMPSLDLLLVYGELTKIPVSVILFMGMEEKDVKKSKLKVFRELKPTIDKLIKEVIF